MTPDDPRMTAFALNALSEIERRDVECDVRSDAELHRECEETAAFAQKLKRALSIELNASLTEDHWREIHAEAAVIGFSPAAAIPLPRRVRCPSWAIPAAAGILFGAIVTSVALTWHDTPQVVVKIMPAGEPKPVAFREAPTAVANPVRGGEMKPAVVAVAAPATETKREPISATWTRPSAPAPAPTSQPSGAVAQAVQQPLMVREIVYEIAPQNSPSVAATPSQFSAPQVAPQPSSFRSSESARDFSGGPVVAAANTLPSLPPLVFIPTAPGSSGFAPAPITSSPPAVIFPPDGLSGTDMGGERPGAPDGNPGPQFPPVTEAPKVDEIAWRRPIAPELLGSLGGGRVPKTSGPDAGATLEMMRLDPGMYPTLEYLCTVLDHDVVALGASDGELSIAGGKSTQPKTSGPRAEQFCFRDAPEVKVLVLLDNGGASVSDTPGSTKVLSISAPFIGLP